jgi:hypothetical protein
MRKLLWVLFAVGTLAACKKEAAPEAGQKEGGSATQAGGSAAGAPEDAAEGKPYALTQQKLDAYVGYQRRMLDVYAATLSPPAVKAVRAGTPSDTQALAESMKRIESKAQKEAEARREANLSEEDVNRIGALVTDVIGERHLAAMMDLGGELQKLEATRAKLSPEQQQEMDPEIEALRKQVQKMEKLEALRATHGNANVDLVLTREKDLLKNYQDMLRAFGGKAQ